MGASARTLDVNFRAVGVDAVTSGMRRVRNEAKAVGEAAGEAGEGLSHGAIFGIAEFTRGLGRLADTGQASSLAMRELAGGVMRLGAALGPGAGLIGIVALLGGVFYEHFSKAREEMRKTEEQFKQSIGNMANAGQGEQLKQKIREAWFGTPFDEKGQLQNPSFIKGAFQGSLIDLRARMAPLQARLNNPVGDNLLEQSADVIKTRNAIAALQPQLDAAEKKYRDLVTALENLQSQPASMGMLPVKSTAQKGILSPEEMARNAKELQKLQNYIDGVLQHETLQGMGVQLTRGIVGANNIATIQNARSLLGEKGPGVAKIPLTVSQADAKRFLDEFDKTVNEPLARAVKDGLAKTLGSAIADGITAGFQSHSIAGAFKGMGKAILAGLGSIFEQMGETMITFGIAATGFAKAMLNPLTAGPSAIAYGALLVALGASLGAIAQGGSGGGYGGGSSSLPSIDTTTYLTTGNAGSQGSTMTPKSSGTTNVWVIGTDPKAWRDVQKQLDINARLSGG